MACAASTERDHPAVRALAHPLDLDRAFSLAPGVALRPERFGALAYDFSTRRLSFLKSRRLLEVVEALAAAPTARAACEAAGVREAELERYRRSLAVLAQSGVIVEREDG